MKQCLICRNKLKNEYEICEDCMEEITTQFYKLAFHHYSEHDLLIHYYNTFSKARNSNEINVLEDLKTRLVVIALLQNLRYYNSTLLENELRNHLLQLNGFEEDIQRPLRLNLKDIKHPSPVDKKRFISEDGHLVKSYEEQVVDNILYNAQIAHAYEKKVDEITEETVICDWYIPVIADTGIYIELWGDINSKKYKERKFHKKRLYEKYNVPFVGIESTKYPDNQILQTHIIEKINSVKKEILENEKAKY